MVSPGSAPSNQGRCLGLGLDKMGELWLEYPQSPQLLHISLYNGVFVWSGLKKKMMDRAAPAFSG